eukprot:NODE_137_length_16306_cov_0.462640.p9 type:complete len:143 gc:universal NODE_137_length_16306_cov_0.462640:14965-15393(+)
MIYISASLTKLKQNNITFMDGRIGEWGDYFNEDVKDALMLIEMYNKMDKLEGTTIEIKDNLYKYSKQTNEKFQKLDVSLEKMEQSVVDRVNALNVADNTGINDRMSSLERKIKGIDDELSDMQQSINTILESLNGKNTSNQP